MTDSEYPAAAGPAEVVVEADGGSRGNPGPAGYGAVVRDAADGQVLAETAEYLGRATNNVAEYRGLIAGLHAAHRVAPDARVRVRMDSKLVVEQMSGRWKIKHPDMRPLAAEAGAVYPAGRVRYEWIPRAENGHADRLANEAMDAGKRGTRWAPETSTAELRAADAAAGAAANAATDAQPAGPATGAAGPVAGAAGPATRAAGPVAGAAGPAGAGPESRKPTGQARAEQAAAGWGGEPGTPTTLVLLRHGETPLTPEKRFSGSGADPDLSPAGERQAHAAAAALAARGRQAGSGTTARGGTAASAARGTIQAVITSPLLRCRRTAEIAGAALGLEPRVEEGLREADFGAWEGLTFAEVQQKHPEDLSAWLGAPDAEPTGGGESFDAVARRVAVTRDRIIARWAGRTVLLVTHVSPVKSLVRLALNAPPEAMYRMELSAASLSAVAYYPSGTASLRLFNETAHLR